MKVKNDHSSKCSNLRNWKEEGLKKKSGLQRDSNPWPPGSNPVEALTFFQASSFQLLKLENLLGWSVFTFNNNNNIDSYQAHFSLLRSHLKVGSDQTDEMEETCAQFTRLPKVWTQHHLNVPVPRHWSCSGAKCEQPLGETVWATWQRSPTCTN